MITEPYNSSDDPFERLKSRILQRMREEGIEEELSDVVKDTYHAYTQALRAENIILSRREHNRLLQAVLKDLLDDALGDFMR